MNTVQKERMRVILNFHATPNAKVINYIKHFDKKLNLNQD